MQTIADVVTRLDANITDITETRIFNLLHADATEMATLLTTLYSDNSTTNTQQPTRGNRGGGLPFGLFGGGQQTQSQDQPSQRALLEAKMVAVADPRTNSVIVSSSHDMMEEIALTVGRLDSSDSKKQHIQVYTLENADPDNVASILRGMFTVNGANTPQTQQTTDVLSQRTETGASTDVVNTLNTNSTPGTGGGGRGQ